MNKKSFIVKGLAFAMGTMSFTACSNIDNEAPDPFVPDVPETVYVDATDFVETDGWGGAWCATQYAPAVTTNDGRTAQMMENYQGNVDATGVLLQQKITGLDNGTYVVELYANAFFTDGRGFTSDMADGATDVAYVFANDVKEPVVGNIATATAKNGEYKMTVNVTDGTLTLGLGKNKPGTNWHTIQIKSLMQETPLKDAYIEAMEWAKNLMFEPMNNSAREALVAATHLMPSYESYIILSTAVANAMQSRLSYGVIEYGKLEDNTINGWTCTNAQGIHVNTWSVEGNDGNDPSGMKTPFIENWINKNDGALGNGEISYTLPYLEPGETYTVSALVRAYSEAGNDISGAEFFVGDSSVDIAFGTSFEYNGMKGIYRRFSTTGTVDENGELKFGVRINDATFNWIAIKEVTIK